jgi:hypothetical protein
MKRKGWVKVYLSDEQKRLSGELLKAWALEKVWFCDKRLWNTQKA